MTKLSLTLTAVASVALLGACDQIRIPGVDSPAAEEELSAPVAELEAAPEAPAEDSAPIEATEDEIVAPESAVRTATIDWQKAREDFASQDTGDNITPATSNNIAVPILLPEIPVTAASLDESPLRFTPVADGYIAVVQGETYDMIVNGTDKLIAAPEGMSPLADDAMEFSDTLTGSQVAFARYGASYLVEFACKGPASATSCISEADAKQEVQSLFLAGTQ